MTADIAARVAEIRAAIADACRRAGRAAREVRLIAVTKSEGAEVLPPLLAAGVSDIGENRLYHLEAMHAAAPPGLAFHAIGRVQGRQLAKLAPLVACLHSLCEADHVGRLARACAAVGRRLPVFLQVNTSGEASKAGVGPAALPALLDLARRESALDVVGLMTMAPEVAEGGAVDVGVVRRCFADCRELARRHALPRLSMGMSEDFIIAVEEGATDVRIGRRLFR